MHREQKALYLLACQQHHLEQQHVIVYLPKSIKQISSWLNQNLRLKYQHYS